MANANAFAGSTWIVQQTDRYVIIAASRSEERKTKAIDANFFTDLVMSKTLLLKGEDFDVFGDGWYQTGVL